MHQPTSGRGVGWPRSPLFEALAGLGVLALLAWLLGPIIDVLLLVFAGLLAGLFVSAISQFIAERMRVAYRLALGLFCLALLALGVGAIALAAPEVGRQLDALGQTLPRALAEVTSRLEGYEWGRTLLDRARDLDTTVRDGESLERAGGFLSSTLGAFASALVFLFVGLFVAFEPDTYRDGLVRLCPPSRRPRFRAVLGKAAQALRLWMLGKLAAMIAVGVLTWLGLFALDIPLSLTLALLAALLTFVPNFGPVLSAVPAVLLGFLEGPATAAYVVALYIAVQTVESYVLTPLIQRKTLSLPPALTLVAQVMLGTLVGAIGLAVATPLMVVLIVFVTCLYVDDVLEA